MQYVILGLILGLILFITVYQYIRIMRYVRISRKMAKRAVPFEQNVKDPVQNFLIIGDSSGVGTGAEKPSYSMAGRLGKDFPKAKIINQSVNGLRTRGLLKSFKPEQGAHYDLMMVHIGGNDVLHLTPYKDLEIDLAALIKKVKPYADYIVFVTGGDFAKIPLFPWPVNHFFGHRSRKVRDLFKRVAARNNVLYLDIISAEDVTPFTGNAEVFYAIDKFHLDGDGYAYSYDRLRDYLAENGFGQK